MSAESETTDQPHVSHKHKKRWFSTRWAWFLIGLLIGVLGLLAVRFATYSMPETHYHANFAVYINGQRETFKDATYYEEVKVCSLHGATPQARVHMHDEENGVVHVHDDAVTWGDLFANLGWSVGGDFIHTRTTLYQANDTDKVNIILNGQDLTDLTNIQNEVIHDKDRLLVSYGPSDENTLQSQFKTVPSSADSYDTRPDPASCSGGEETTWQQKLHHLF